VERHWSHHAVGRMRSDEMLNFPADVESCSAKMLNVVCSNVEIDVENVECRKKL
jgi:hypothetical protein